MATPGNLRIEHHRSALGIGERRPRLSWKTTAEPGWTQGGYELRITRGGETESHRVDGNESVLVPWPSAPLRSRERATVAVRVRGSESNAGGYSAWSDEVPLEAGLLEPGDWSAVPVGGAWPEDPESDDRRPALVRRDFSLDGTIASARLYASAHGLYEIEINGQRVGDEALAPGWTPYKKRLRYYSYDVTAHLVTGDNAIGSWLGDGWYRGRMGWRGGFRNLFGSDLSLIAQLEVTFTDGRTQTISTDGDWRAAMGPIVRTGNYDGEVYDARDERTGWSSAGFDDGDWTPVAIAERDPATLVAPQGPPVRCTQEVTPVDVLTTPSGKTVLDLGQNLVGRLRIRVTGQSGQTVTIRTAEVMQEGEIYTRPLREAKSTDVYTLAGRSEPEEWEPRFTFHGFRYAEITGWPGDVAEAVANGDIVARVYHSDMERTGWFTSSNPLVNQLHENVVWGMRGNVVDVPTDCPQRDERVGWTGDIQVFAPTASYLYDSSGFLSGWLRDVEAEQLPDGTVPWYVPVIPAHQMWTPIRPGAVWGDVAVLTPWVIYQRYGDVGVLGAQYSSAKAWVDLVDRLAGDSHLWNTGFQLGDWLDPSAPPQDPADVKTDRYLVATAYFAWSTQHLALSAAVLGRTDEAEHYGTLAAQIREAFAAEYLLADGSLTSDAQTAYALAISFDLIPDAERRQAAGRRLAELVAEADNRIAAGFAGVNLISDALTATGQNDAAYDLLLNEQAPGWLYAVTMGATTVWERWDAMLPDGTVHPGTMTSFNHYALGAVADWLHRVVAGLAPAEPGYRTIRFAPRPGGGFEHAAAEHETPYGLAAIAWRLEGSEIVADVTVPTGATGIVALPGAEEYRIGSGTHTVRAAQPSSGR
ncbi:MAG: family 78 glycoside hydrolase catalytic domain [Mycetocola sp.]